MVSKKVFIASDGFTAFIDRGHPKHLHAAAFFRYFAQNNFQLYTTPVTLNDTYKELSQTISPSVAKDFLRALQFSSVNLIYPEESDIKLTFKTIIGSSSVELTFTKSLMAVVCNKRNIPQICTFEYMHALFGLQVFYLPI